MIVLDAMDQSKFCYPRHAAFTSHQFDDFQRPRAHVYGAYVHGFCTFLSISAADVSKGGSTTVEILAYLLTLLSKHVDLSTYDVRILLDNASSANKNNTVLAFAGMLVCAGLVASSVVMFLRVGHTHEDRT